MFHLTDMGIVKEEYLSHPGTNNAYEVKIKSKLTEKANNEAVL